MDKSLFTACRYTGITKTSENEADFRVCFNCGGITHKTVGDPRHTSYDLTVDNTVAKTEEIIPETDLLKQEAFRCSYCAEVLPDYSLLSHVITFATDLNAAAVEGLEIGQYEVGSKDIFELAIQSAEDFVLSMDLATTALTVNDVEYTADELILAEIHTLETAILTFKLSKVPDIGDTTELETHIGVAQIVHDGAVEGVDIGEYEVGSKAILQTAIDAAQAVVDKEAPPATTTEVASAVDALLLALGVFESGKVLDIGDTTQLQTNIASAQLLHDEAVEGVAIGEYPDGSKAILQTAIDEAQAVVDKEAPPATTAEVAGAVTTLQGAVDLFEGLIITE